MQIRTIDRPADLLECKTINQQMAESPKRDLVTYVTACIMQCAWRLELEVDPARVTDQSIALINQYGNDSLEDISEALRKGGQGVYDYGHHKRGTLPGALIREWMGRHLDEKIEAMETRHQNKKHRNPLKSTYTNEQIDQLHEAVKRGRDRLKEKSEREREERRLIMSYNRGMFQAMAYATDMEQAKIDYVTEHGELDEYLEKHLNT